MKTTLCNNYYCSFNHLACKARLWCHNNNVPATCVQKKSHIKSSYWCDVKIDHYYNFIISIMNMKYSFIFIFFIIICNFRSLIRLFYQSMDKKDNLIFLNAFFNAEWNIEQKFSHTPPPPRHMFLFFHDNYTN